MDFFVVIPQGCGVLGALSQADYSSESTQVVSLHCEIQLPSSDDLVSCGSCYLVSSALCEKVSTLALTGYTLQNSHITLSPQYHILHPIEVSRVLNYKWFVANGRPFESDFSMYLGRLIVSDPAKAFLEGFRIDQCEITPKESFPFDWNTRKNDLVTKAREQLRARRANK